MSDITEFCLKPKNIIAVTGTNGKTSMQIYFIKFYQLIIYQ